MTSMTNTISNRISRIGRRAVLSGLAAGAAVLALPGAGLAFSVERARSLIDKVVADVQSIIDSGKSEAAMLRDFEKIFDNYGDVYRIGVMVLGADGRSASSSQKRAFAEAFKLYISHKYGRRFREFIGGYVEVVDAEAVKSYYEVTTFSHLQGRAPFDVVYVVADDSGKFIDMVIEGISLVKSERAEIGAMLDKRRGNLDQLIADLRTM